MFITHSVQTTPKRLVAAAGLVMSAALLLLSPDVHELADGMSFQDSKPAGRERLQGSIPHPQPIPPAMQVGVFRR